MIYAQTRKSHSLSNRSNKNYQETTVAVVIECVKHEQVYVWLRLVRSPAVTFAQSTLRLQYCSLQCAAVQNERKLSAVKCSKDNLAWGLTA